ncbi:MAG TPA: phosphatase PAP2 family protein [Allosphingosinicella sp.]|nr:phosphatase PAP2 family protein [Allosphingosinicella sp.]
MDPIVRLSDWLYLLLNGLAGRSWLLDTIVSLPLDNNLVKAGPIGACFVYAWWSGDDQAETRRRRATLLVTMASLLFVMATTKTLGDHIFQPRPFVHAHQAWHLEEGRLVETPKLAYREPLNGQVRARTASLKRGEIDQNDLVSFPSDHAGFFFALALGIFFACRRSGAVALAWTGAAILLPRIITGMHSPLDIVAGAAIGAAVLLAFQVAARGTRRWALEPLAGWTLRHEALAAALLFFVAYESTNVLTNVRDLAGTGGEIVEQFGRS